MLKQSVIFPLFITTIFAAGRHSESFSLSDYTPRYQESLQNFELATKYIQWHLSKTNPVHADVAFAVLVAVTGGLVEEYTINPKYFDHLPVIARYRTYGLQNFVPIATAFEELIEDINIKIRPLTNIINASCTSDSYFQCNEIVKDRMRAKPYMYVMPSKLLIHLGKVSKNIMKNKVLLEKLINNNEVFPYLSLHGQDVTFMTMVKRMSKTFVILQRMGYM